MESLERIIAEHPFFAGLDARYTDLLTGCASNVRFAPGSYIFREGEEANRFYLIRAGKVALEIFSLRPDRLQSKPSKKETFWAGLGSYLLTSGVFTRTLFRTLGRLLWMASVSVRSAKITTTLGTNSSSEFLS